jgi:hypothetical protein
MVELNLNDETVQGIASKYALEDVDSGENTGGDNNEQQQQADAVAEATRLAAEEASKEKPDNQGGDGQGDKGDAGEDGDGDAGGDEPTPISHLIKQYGYKVEDFADIDIKDDSVEGIKKFYDKRDLLIKETARKEFLGEDPDIEDLIAHKQAGLSIESWKAKKEAESFKLEFEADDVEGKANFLTTVYVNRGVPEKRAKLLVEAIKDDNELDAEVAKETTTIKASLQQQADAKIESEKAALAKEAEDTLKVVNQVNSIIKEGNLDNLIIPETDRKAFNEFVLSEKLTEKHEKLTLQQRLFIDYLVYKDFKVKGIEKQVAKATGTPRVRMTATAGEGNDNGAKEWKSLDELKNAINKRQ